MANYLSKNTILRAYAELSKLTNDPSAQGATQVTSSLRYLFALDEFTKAFNRPCNTQDRSDRDKFITFVGNVVSIGNNLYTANFFHSIKSASDFAVGSNFFSVNTVKTSLENKSREYEFPKRGNSPLFIIQDGKLIERASMLNNLNSLLSSNLLKTSFALWLARNIEVSKEDFLNSLLHNLRKRYSNEIVDVLNLTAESISLFGSISFQNESVTFTQSDFPKGSLKENERATDNLLEKEALIPKVREAFMTFWGVVKPNLDNIPLYVQKFEDVFNPAIERLGLGISNIFEILGGQQFDSIVGLMVKADSSLNYIIAEKNSNGHGPGGDNYYIWSSHRRYKDFLKVLAISDFRANIDKQKERNVQMATLSADLSQLSYLRAMRTKPFLLLAGISGTGKSRIVKQMAFDSCLDVGDLRKDPTSPGNYCLIEVKPNWHDSTELLGYESKIGGAHYQLTTFVKFLAKAMLFPDVPFFVCLDEMNLAPVEQYFAEFLSVLESRTKKNGHVVSEPLIKAEIFRKYSSLEKSLFSKEEDTTAYQDSLGTVEPEAPYGKEAQVFAHLKEHGLRIPENVIIIGTVNMDETTHQFSRKVIDRAMTIEMNLPEGDPFMDFFENSSNLEYREEPSSASLYLSTEVRAADVIEILTSESEEEIESLKHQVANFLRGLNAALDKTPFQVAYRVQNELVLYFYQLWLEDKSVAWSDILTNACDQILMMKVLPRIEGDEELLEEPLKRLSEFCQPYTNASKKLIFMTERLAQSRFASFWP